jgi:hypothetical protein
VAKLLFINENAALIQCEFVPQYGQMQESEAEQLEGTICRPKCGYWRDAALRNQERKNKGQEDFTLLCLHPTSPYLPELMKKLKEKGKLE